MDRRFCAPKIGVHQWICSECKAKLKTFRASCEFAKTSAGGEHVEIDWASVAYAAWAQFEKVCGYPKKTTQDWWRASIVEHTKKVPNVAKVQMDPDDLLALLEVVEGK